MAQVVVVRFKKGCKPYYFGAGGLTLEQGQGVIVETARGLEYAIVVDPLREVPDESVVQPLKNVIRVATERDKAVLAEQEARRPEAMRICKEKIAARELPMKLIDCEFTFDGSKVVFTFTSEGRVDFRELVRDLASVFHLRIELRQVGIRDEARILGGIAPCGREVCCAGCMPDFKKVSIKMAKNQGLSLNPGKISGLCGRLMCCLAYEDEYYASVCKQVPKLGANVSTPEGRGSVVSVNMLKMEVRVRIEKDGVYVYRDFPADQVRRGEQMPDKADKEGKERAEAEQAPLPSAEDELAAADGSRSEGDARPRGDRSERSDRPDRGGRPKERGGQNARPRTDKFRGGHGKPDRESNDARGPRGDRHGGQNMRPHRSPAPSGQPSRRPESDNPKAGKPSQPDRAPVQNERAPQPDRAPVQAPAEPTEKNS